LVLATALNVRVDMAPRKGTRTDRRRRRPVFIGLSENVRHLHSL
jgi:hypothetical protein